MFCGLSLYYNSAIRLLIVNNIVIVTIDFNVNNDSDQHTKLTSMLTMIVINIQN